MLVDPITHTMLATLHIGDLLRAVQPQHGSGAPQPPATGANSSSESPGSRVTSRLTCSPFLATSQTALDGTPEGGGIEWMSR